MALCFNISCTFVLLLLLSIHIKHVFLFVLRNITLNRFPIFTIILLVYFIYNVKYHILLPIFCSPTPQEKLTEKHCICISLYRYSCWSSLTWYSPRYSSSTVLSDFLKTSSWHQSCECSQTSGPHWASESFGTGPSSCCLSFDYYLKYSMHSFCFTDLTFLAMPHYLSTLIQTFYLDLGEAAHFSDCFESHIRDIWRLQ